MHQYDLIFGLGAACSCTQSLRRAGLQVLSFPYDWLTPLDGADLLSDMRMRAETVCNGFDDWFQEKDFTFHGTNTNGKDKYYNEKLHFIFLHDFPQGVPLTQSFPAVRSKYRRRIDRLLDLIRRSKTVLVVRLDRHDLPCRTSVENCTYVRDILNARYPGTVFDVLLIQPDPEIPIGEWKVERPAEGVIRLTLDYRKDKTPAPASQTSGADRITTPQPPDFPRIVSALRQICTVREYRTPEEIAANRERQLRKRWAKIGARTALEYRWKKISLPAANAFAKTLGPLVARLRRKRFAQILPLGINCETAFRFFRKWGFVESSLFAWAQSRNLATITSALERFDEILAGSVALNPSDHLWLCGNSGIRFHGKLKWTPGLSPSQVELDADLADLKGRLAHLKDKFRNSLRNAETTLLVHRLAAADAADPRLADKLDALEAALLKLGAANWRLLVICERKDLNHMPKGPNRIFRAVRAFNPGSAITDARLGDPTGWNAIFSEFAPNRILPKAHAFKFE